MRLTAFLPTLSLLLLSFAPSALADGDWGPDLGSALPDALASTTQGGEAVELGALAQDNNGLVVAFVRSADWCPFCKRQLIELSGQKAEFDKRGLKLVSVSYDSVDILQSFGQQHDIGFDMLSDPKSMIIDAFGIRNMDQKPGSAGDGIPHPGIMVFDKDGTLIAKFAEKSYRKRPKIDDVLAATDAALGK